MKIKTVSGGVLAVLVLMGNAHADEIKCPPFSAIREAAEQGENSKQIKYTAPAAGNRKWTGVILKSEQNHRKDLRFIEATIRSRPTGGYFVACDYAGSEEGGLRMTLPTNARPLPAGDSWDMTCTEKDPEQCILDLQ